MIFAPGETTVYDVLRSNAISYGRIRQVGDRADTAYHSLQLSNAGGIGVNLNGRATLRMIPPADSVHFLILHGFQQVFPRSGQPVFLQTAIIKPPSARLCRDQCGGWRSKTTTLVCYPSRRLVSISPMISYPRRRSIALSIQFVATRQAGRLRYVPPPSRRPCLHCDQLTRKCSKRK